ncbi:hypothetical protein E1A91_D06G116400v1 [Gossypium mustelinum]|uniref:Uncharacterized protein n=1 Tax=Gossypium mustelinum TaxID=34275 RepID=A0A5D2UKB9_GOSMU|nr:hypothetical protein E1A91_D06G116400v1 [Gossypium mustelinum]TYI77011.1 hypothetical protein E1A91_D06G116400v1 [Gossypium mustelinum]
MLLVPQLAKLCKNSDQQHHPPMISFHLFSNILKKPISHQASIPFFQTFCTFLSVFFFTIERASPSTSTDVNPKSRPS